MWEAIHTWCTTSRTPGQASPSGSTWKRSELGSVSGFWTCANAPKDATWLAYQEEIGRRHYDKKNQTDGVESVPFVHFRYMVAFIYPITATIRPFLAKKGHTAEEVEKMHQAWFKAVVLTVVLWCRPYVKEGLF